MTVNYQQVVDILVVAITLAVPIGFIFGVVEKIINMFFSFAFGKNKVSL